MAPYPEDGDNCSRANRVGSIAFIFARVFCDLQVCNTQLSVILLVDDKKAARGINNVLQEEKWGHTKIRIGELVAKGSVTLSLHSYQATGWHKTAVSTFVQGILSTSC